MCKEMNEAEMVSVYEKLFRPFPYFNAPLPFEWHLRFAATHALNIADKSEAINSNVTVLRQKGAIQGAQLFEEFERVSIETDINTKLENQEFRFNAAQLPGFYTAACVEHETVLAACLAQIA